MTQPEAFVQSGRDVYRMIGQSNRVGRCNDAGVAAPSANLGQTSPRIFQLNVRENSIIQKRLTHS